MLVTGERRRRGRRPLPATACTAARSPRAISTGRCCSRRSRAGARVRARRRACASASSIDGAAAASSAACGVGATGARELLRARVTIAADGRRSTLAFGLGLARHPAAAAALGDRRLLRAASSGAVDARRDAHPARPLHRRRAGARRPRPTSVWCSRRRRRLPICAIRAALLAARARGRPDAARSRSPARGSSRRRSCSDRWRSTSTRPVVPTACCWPAMPPGFIDPMTGDGLRFAVRGGELAARAALEALEHGWAGVHARLAARTPPRVRGEVAVQPRAALARRLAGGGRAPRGRRAHRAGRRARDRRARRRLRPGAARAMDSSIRRSSRRRRAGDSRLTPWLARRRSCRDCMIVEARARRAQRARAARARRHRAGRRRLPADAGRVSGGVPRDDRRGRMCAAPPALRRSPPAPLVFVVGQGAQVVGDRRRSGACWTFRVIVVPGTTLVASGPYRFMRHPNYVAVVGELVGVALMTGARVTGPLATLGVRAADAAAHRGREPRARCYTPRAADAVAPAHVRPLHAPVPILLTRPPLPRWARSSTALPAARRRWRSSSRCRADFASASAACASR